MNIITHHRSVISCCRMAHGTILCVIYAFGLIQEGLSALIQSQPVMAALGQEARLHCQLLQHKRVEQITWWKEGKKNIASYHIKHGKKVNPDFRNKVNLDVPDLHNSSIIIHSVMEEDGGCYMCRFNTLPEGAFIARTCLTVYELHEPVLQIESNSSKDLVVTCSTTGWPVPTVTLNIPGGEPISVNAESINANANGTVTVTRTALLSGSHDDCTQVECAAQVLSEPPRKTFMKLLKVKQPSYEGFYEESTDSVHSRIGLIAMIPFAVLCVCGCLIVFRLRPKTELKTKNRDQEMELMSLCTHEDTEVAGTSAAVPKTSNQIRKRTPPEKSPTTDNTNTSPEAVRNISFSSE